LSKLKKIKQPAAKHFWVHSTSVVKVHPTTSPTQRNE